MSQIWTIDTTRLDTLKASSLAEQTLSGTFTPVEGDASSFTAIRKQASDTVYIDLFVNGTWEKIAITGGTIEFTSASIGETTRSWLKSFSALTSTSLTNISGYTWVGDQNLDIVAGTSDFGYVYGTVIGKQIFYLRLGHDNDGIYVSVYESDPFNTIILYAGDHWISNDANIVHIDSGGGTERGSFIKFLLTYGDLVPRIFVDLSALDLPQGTHLIQMRLSDDGHTHADSDLSSPDTYYTVLAKLNACSAEIDTDNNNVVIITPDDGNGAATQFAMYDNGATTGVVIPRQV